MSATAQIEQPRVNTLRMSELIRPNPKQREFLSAMRRYAYLLYGGAAGGGKSFILRWGLLLFLVEAFARYHVRGCRVGLFCEDYTSLRDRQISKMKREIPRELGEVRSTKDEGLVHVLPESLGGGFISLRNLDDPTKYQSVEFAAIAVDELTKNPPGVFEDLRMRLRWPGFPAGFVFPFMAATNPGSVGHAWVKRYWIDRDIPRVLDPGQFCYIKALASDNPMLPADYERTQLATIVDPQKRKAFQEGDWNMFAGQFFSEWRDELHVCDGFAVPRWWRRFRAMDWGYANPWASYWMAVDPDGDVYVYRELYERERDTEWMAKRVKELSEGEEIDYTVLDPSCWDASRGKSIADQLQEYGIACVPADNDRRSGWSQVRSFLAWQNRSDGTLARKPRLHIFGNCANLARTMPALVYAAANSEDCDTDGEDHGPDALRYGLMSRPSLSVQPIETMAQEDAEALLRLQQRERGGRDNYWTAVTN